MLTITFYEVSTNPFDVSEGDNEDETEWYWRATSANGEIIADGGQSYADEDNARHGFNALKLGLAADEGYMTEILRHG